MLASNLAISVITFKRSHLLDLCLESLSRAMKELKYPIYVTAQDPGEEEEKIFLKYANIISSIKRVDSYGLPVEELINNNRIKAWETALLEHNHSYVVCLEDDVIISKDFFHFTEKVLEQNRNEKNFRGINYGSFEISAEASTYSRLRYGLHGPASLISSESLKIFQLQKLKKLKGRIPWDAWVEPIAKTGFMVTSNISRYSDNGINGTHASMLLNSDYFKKLHCSFEMGPENFCDEYSLKNVVHSWRKDCVPFTSHENLKYHLMKILVRSLQYFNLFI